MYTTLLTIAAVATYFASGTVFALRLFGSQENKPSKLLGVGSGFVALLLHLAILYQALHTANGLNFSFFNAVSFAAWVVCLVFLLSCIRKPLETLGIVLLPIAGITLLLALWFPGMHLLPPDAQWYLRSHVLISLLAYSVLTMAAIQAILLAVQDSQLRKHHPGGFMRALPPLQTMEALMFEMIFIGFVLLSISLLTGFLFLDDMFAQRLVHKTILSILAWLAFAILLWGRFRFGWRGRTAIRWTLVGFGVLVLAYFGSKAVIELILK
jgi:ABC-type uncharacterized transport system permease subunit